MAATGFNIPPQLIVDEVLDAYNRGTRIELSPYSICLLENEAMATGSSRYQHYVSCGGWYEQIIENALREEIRWLARIFPADRQYRLTCYRWVGYEPLIEATENAKNHHRTATFVATLRDHTT